MHTKYIVMGFVIVYMINPMHTKYILMGFLIVYMINPILSPVWLPKEQDL